VKRKRNIILGVTGGVASGKSSAAREFGELGALVVDSDAIARDILNTGSRAWKKTLKYFGRRILMPDNQINRQKLAGIVFSDPAKRKVLEKITHPSIIREIKKRLVSAARLFSGFIVLDAPLLFEAGLEKDVDKIIVVWVPEKMQISRLAKRNGISRKDALERVKAQLPLNKKRRLADYVIDNSGAYGEIRRQVRMIARELKEAV
jgi:dephospho-CoA kinase